MRLAPQVLTFILLASPSLANYVLKPWQQGNHINLSAKNIPLPKEELSKKLKTGFTTTIAVQSQLIFQRKAIQSHRSLIQIYYDLWEEYFDYRFHSDKQAQQKRFKSIDNLIAQLENLNIQQVASVSQLDPKKYYKIKTTLLINPIEQDRVKKIRKWIADNSVAPVPDPTGTQSSAHVRFSALFDRIFSTYLSQNATKASWKQTLNSRPFLVGGLSHEE